MEINAEERKKKRLPLSILLEGRSWILTAVLEATISLWMVSLAFDGFGLLVSQTTKHEKGMRSLANLLLYMSIGAFSAGVAFGALSLNFSPVEHNTWRRRSCCSIFALAIIDLMAINHLFSVVSTAFGILDASSENFVSLPAAIFLAFVGVCCTVIFNVIYIREFGCCTCCCTSAAGERFVHQSQNWQLEKEIPMAKIVTSASYQTETNAEIEEDDRSNSEVSFDDHSPTMMDFLSNSSSIVSVQKRPPNRCKTSAFIEFGAKHPSSQVMSSLPSSSTAPNNSVMEENNKVTDCEVVIEEEAEGPQDLDSVLQRSAPIGHHKATESHHCFSKAWFHDIWSSLKEEPGHFRYAVWIKSAFFTSVVVLIFTCIRRVQNIFSFADNYELNRDRIAENMEAFDDFLRNLGWVNGVDSIGKMSVVKLYLVADHVILDLKWTSLVAYPLGTLFSLYGLVAVLAQHKRMSIAVSNALNVLNSQSSGKQERNKQWQEFQKKYPILGACFFVAILSSTAIIQLEIVGSILSVLLAYIVNITKLNIIFDLFGNYLIAYVVAFVINQSVFLFLKSSVITKDGFGIRHPRWFNFFLILLSMVHLVIGILYALWRMLYLLLTTILVLNRLDVSLFTTGKRLDNGHNAFMSMLVLTVLVQQDAEHFSQVEKSQSRKESV